jgi:hypothetical protein
MNKPSDPQAPLPELAARLRALPAHPPPPDLVARVEAAALAALAEGAADADAPADAADAPVAAWRAYLAAFTYRAALPGALAGATLIYLNWAIRAASQMY